MFLRNRFSAAFILAFLVLPLEPQSALRANDLGSFKHKEITENGAEDFRDVDISQNARIAIGTLRALALTGFIAVATYLDHHNMSPTYENIMRASRDIQNNPEAAKALVPGAIAGIQSLGLTIYIRRFQEFLVNPKVLHFSTESIIKKLGGNITSPTSTKLLLASKELESFTRSAAVEVAYMAPIFVALTNLGFSEYQGVDAFIRMLFFSSLLTNIAQSLPEVALHNLTGLAKSVAKTASSAKFAQAVGVAVASVLSVVATGGGILHGMGSTYGTAILGVLCVVGGGSYIVYLKQKYESVREGLARVVFSNHSSESYWLEKRESMKRKARRAKHVTSSCRRAFRIFK